MEQSNPRTEEELGICGDIHFGATGIEWVCIRPIHDYGSQVATHNYVLRWPNRGKRED